MLRLEGCNGIVVGGGKVAVRRVKSLLECGAKVTVIAPEAEQEIADLAQAEKIAWHRRPYEDGDVFWADLLVVASSSHEANEAAAEEAKKNGALINRADAPEAGNIEIPAHGRKGPLTVAVHTGGASAKAAAMIRDEVMGKLDPKWADMLATLAAMRKQIQEEMPPGEAREEKLRRLAEELFR